MGPVEHLVGGGCMTMARADERARLRAFVYEYSLKSVVMENKPIGDAEIVKERPKRSKKELSQIEPESKWTSYDLYESEKSDPWGGGD